MTDLSKIVKELDELMKPYKVCVCADSVAGRFIENRFTFECVTCRGVIPLQWSVFAEGSGDCNG